MTGEHMAQGNNTTAMCSQQTRLTQHMTNRECHSSVTKPRENPDKGDRTVTLPPLKGTPPGVPKEGHKKQDKNIKRARPKSRQDKQIKTHTPRGKGGR